MAGFPNPILEFNRYMIVIKGRSPRTVDQYNVDISMFLRYIYAKRNSLPLIGSGFDEIDISALDTDFVGSVSKNEVMDFFSYTAVQRHNNARVRARKLSALRSFYKYHCEVKMDVDFNPVANIDSPKIPSTLPKYLTLDESLDLLKAVDSDTDADFRERNFAIITVFLNCGLRLSELVGINLSDIDRDMTSIRVTGKGSKERVIYLNDACKEALTAYLKVRNADEVRPDSKGALFLSRMHRRMDKSTVQWVVKKYLAAAGLEYRHLSTHKLRHTAATLMYQTGKVDIRVLKDILGHEQLNTTQIYTHVSDESMQKAIKDNPLAGIVKKIKQK